MFLAPAYSEPSVVLVMSSLKDQDNDLKGSDLKTFVPAFDIPSQIKKNIRKVTPKKYQQINLEKTLQDKKLVRTVREAEGWFGENTLWSKAKSVISSGFYHAGIIVPGKVRRGISSGYTRLGHYFNIMGILLTPLDMGPNRVALFYRSKNLQEEKQQFKERLTTYIALIVNESCQSNKDNVSALSKEKKELDKWKISINIKERKLQRDYLKYLLEITKYIISNSAQILTFSPYKSLFDIAAIVKNIPGITELLDFALATFALSQTTEQEKIFLEWQKSFQIRQKPLEITIGTKKILANGVVHPLDNASKYSWNQLQGACFKFFKAEMNRLDKIIKESKSLLDKRKATRDKKVLMLAIDPKGQMKVEQFINKWKQGKDHDEVDAVENLTPKQKLEFYVDHKEIVEVSLKPILRQFVAKKQELEKTFLQLKNTQAKYFFWYAAFSFSLALVLGLTALAAGPIFGISAVALGLGVMSVVLNLSFWLVSSMLGSSYKGNSSGLLNFKILYHQVKYEITNYWHAVKEKKLMQVNPMALKIIKSELKQPINGISEKDILEFLESEQRTKELAEKVEVLKELRRQNEWKDFASFASIKTNVDVFKEVFEMLDMNITGKEFKDFLEIELGINVDKLKIELLHENDDVKQRALQILLKDIMTFFTLDDNGCIAFIKFQQARLDSGNI